jgi:hypothetical protein
LQFRLEQRNLAGAVLGYYPDQPFLHGGERAFVLRHGYIPSSPTSGNAFSRAHMQDAFDHPSSYDCRFVDGFLIFTAPLYGEVFSLDQVLGVYRIHGGNISLSAGSDFRRVKAQFQEDRAHRAAVAAQAARLGAPIGSAEDLLGPYSWRSALLINKGYRDRAAPVGYPLGQIVRRGIVAFLKAPKLSLFSRVKNVIAMLALVIAPGSVARRLLPEKAPPSA